MTSYLNLHTLPSEFFFGGGGGGGVRPMSPFLEDCGVFRNLWKRRGGGGNHPDDKKNPMITVLEITGNYRAPKIEHSSQLRPFKLSTETIMIWRKKNSLYQVQYFRSLFVPPEAPFPLSLSPCLCLFRLPLCPRPTLLGFLVSWSFYP